MGCIDQNLLQTTQLTPKNGWQQQPIVHMMASGAVAGGLRQLQLLLPELQKKVPNIHVIGDTDGPMLQQMAAQGFTTHALPMMQSRYNTAILRPLKALLQKIQPSFLHLHGTRAAFFASFIRHCFPEMKTCYHMHGLSYHKARNFLQRWFWKQIEHRNIQHADGILCVSQKDLNDLLSYGFLKNVSYQHLLNSFKNCLLQPLNAEQARNRINIKLFDEAVLPQNMQLVGTVCRLTTQKAVHHLMDAVCLLKDVGLIVIGDGPCRAQLQQHLLVKQGRAFFLGEEENIECYLPAFHVFAMSSLWEGEPVSILEAMAAGLACVATDTTGSHELLGAWQDDCLVPLADPAALAKKINHFLNDPQKREDVGRQLRQSIVHRSNVLQAKNVFRFYEEIYDAKSI